MQIGQRANGYTFRYRVLPIEGVPHFQHAQQPTFVFPYTHGSLTVFRSCVYYVSELKLPFDPSRISPP